MKTAKEIQQFFYHLVKDSILANGVSGSVYLDGYRPRSSKEEDIIVSFTTGNAEQIQQGVVTITVFVQDIAPYENGVKVENGSRTLELEQLALQWFNSLTAQLDYKLSLNDIIGTYADEQTSSHFVSIPIYYELKE
ncbi:MAG: hypothetical protein J6T78_04455 [Bacteroidaceae bacterium]|nr:hypothetical protein [Bacteroidaceae bacterium]